MPFADDINLIEYLFSIPSVFKIHDGWSKFILRQAMQGVIPKRIQMRKDKTFFQPPEFIWLSQAEDTFKKYFTPEVSRFLNIDQLLKDWPHSRYIQHNLNFTFMWRMLNLAVWLKVYDL